MAPLLRHVAEHRLPIALTRRIDKEERNASICHGTHAYASKEAKFIHAELSKQVQEGHVAILLLEAVISLQNMWLSPIAVIKS